VDQDTKNGADGISKIGITTAFTGLRPVTFISSETVNRNSGGMLCSLRRCEKIHVLLVYLERTI
jgi:hypothetical protein